MHTAEQNNPVDCFVRGQAGSVSEPARRSAEIVSGYFVIQNKANGLKARSNKLKDIIKRILNAIGLFLQFISLMIGSATATLQGSHPIFLL